MKLSTITMSIIAILIPGVLFASGLSISNNNYINDLIGGRAMGLGGAFCAISDDPSGAYYNPAGLAFAIDNQISLSVNNYSQKNITIEKVANMGDYKQDISSFYPSFFGVVQSLGASKVAFTIVNTNNEILDQNTLFKNKLKYYDSETGNLTHTGDFLMNYNITKNTLMGGPSFSTFITDSLTVGATVYGLRYYEQQIANQMVMMKEVNTTKKTYNITNTYITDEAYGMVPIIGLQWMPTKIIAVGISAQFGFIFSHERSAQIFKKSAAAGDDMNAKDANNNNLVSLSKGKVSYSDSTLPTIIRTGVAYFPSDKLLVSMDVMLYYGNKYYQSTVNDITVNGAIGVEYYITEQFPARLGIFSNLANTPDVSSSKMNQETHVDMYGIASSISWQTKSSSVTLGGFYQYGEGKSQVFTNDKETQNIKIHAFSISLTGTAMY